MNNAKNTIKYSNKNARILWEGISALDGVTPIVVIATGFAKRTSNAKTGDLIQTFVVHADIDPWDAVKVDATSAICGTCPHQKDPETGKRSCYVQVFHAPKSTWKSYKRGNIGPATSDDLKRLVNGRKVRLGSYGDPAAAPYEVWRALVDASTGSTGYTHAWKTCDPRFASLVMASADSEDDLIDAACLGYRSFHVRPKGADKPKGTMQCPSDPARKSALVACDSCLACDGNNGKFGRSVSIQAHGNGAKYVTA
jgi:hypothetical protein